MKPALTKIPILFGESGSSVFRVRDEDGLEWIEKYGPCRDLSVEAAVMEWCAKRLPVARVLAQEPGYLAMSILPGANLDQTSAECAVAVTVEALRLIHAVPAESCPFDASWAKRLEEAESRIQAGLVDVTDFDDANLGRSPAEILAELERQPPLPDRRCFTQGDAGLQNFLGQAGLLTGIVDLGRAGVTHPAQDWALALRGMGDSFGANGERLLREYLPEDCADEELLRRFRLLDELF